MARILAIDNYDSFTYNLVQMFMHYDLDLLVKRSDRVTLNEIHTINPDYILISPGPRDPLHAGISIPLIEQFYKDIPILGVCLGMQCINEAFGGKTVRAPVPVHGKTASVYHDNRGVFAGVPAPFTAARYHSLMVEVEGDLLQKTAHASDGVVMGIEHPSYPLWGVQFHPESFLTEYGEMLVENFLRTGPVRV